MVNDMDDNWLMTGIVWFQSMMLIYMGFVLWRNNRYLTRLSDALNHSTELLNLAREIVTQQQCALALHGIDANSVRLDATGIERLTPEMRADMREALHGVLLLLRQKEH